MRLRVKPTRRQRQRKDMGLRGLEGGVRQGFGPQRFQSADPGVHRSVAALVPPQRFGLGDLHGLLHQQWGAGLAACAAGHVQISRGPNPHQVGFACQLLPPSHIQHGRTSRMVGDGFWGDPKRRRVVPAWGTFHGGVRHLVAGLGHPLGHDQQVALQSSPTDGRGDESQLVRHQFLVSGLMVSSLTMPLPRLSTANKAASATYSGVIPTSNWGR